MPVLNEIRYALRGFGRAKAATAVLLASLALGAGANAAIYSAIRALLFQPPAGVADPARLLIVHTAQFNGGTAVLSSYPDYLSISASSRTLTALAAFDDS